MDQPQYVLQQEAPLFPTTLFNRPVSRHGAGRLLVVGGHSGEFSLPTAIHQIAMASGVGECPVVLPEPLARLLSGAPDTHFAAANPSGSFGPEALGRILELSEEADAVALGASLSGNSATAMLVERLAAEVQRPIVYFGDALTLVRHNLRVLVDNPDALVIATMPEVFKLAGALEIPIQIRPHAGLINKLEIIQDLRSAMAGELVVYGSEIIVAADTSMIVTPINYELSLNPALFVGALSTFWLQNKANHRAGLATASYLIRQIGGGVEPSQRMSTTALADALAQELKRAED